MTHARIDFIPFKKQHNGFMKMMDFGGYDTNMTTAQATTAARIICGTYGYDKVSVEANGVIIAVVNR